MSFVKREFERWQELTQAAQSIAERVGAITVDPDTDEVEYNYDQNPDRHAYAAATRQYNAGRLNGTREEVVAAVKHVLDTAF
jgi:hypothetical protein